MRAAPRRARRGSLFTRFLGASSGVAAVEFALVVPFLLVVYAGSVELLDGIGINRQVALTASTVANLVAQYTTISASSQLPDVLNASAQILAPHPVASATVTVSCISIDGAGKATVTWSKSLNGTARTAGQVVTLPAQLTSPNSNIILGEATYAYRPIADFLHFGTLTLSGSTYMVPRAATTVNLAP